MILIFSNFHSSRLEYVLKTVFGEFLSIEYQLTHDRDTYQNSSNPKINYSQEDLEGLLIPDSGFLNEQEIRSAWSPEFHNEELPVLFPHDKGIGFDLFSAVFYMLSRYEEYGDIEVDDLGRFPAIKSLAVQKGFLEIPVVDVWIMRLREWIAEGYPNLSIPSPNYEFKTTIDIDNAYAYKNKEWWRAAGGYAQDLLKSRIDNLKKRHAVLWSGKPDPYDTFNHLGKLHEKYAVRPVYFLLLADYAENDKNVSHHNQVFQKLIRRLSQNSELGIHPGFQSNKEPTRISKEKSRLEAIVGREVFASRQHYLMLRFPETYRNLLKAGLREDYSMGYADRVGFRAGTSRPFNFFDLDENGEKDLRIFPFVAMDATLNRYMQLNPEGAIQKLIELNNVVRNTHGMFITLWHNESLSEMREWKSWFDVYEEVLKIGTGQYVQSISE